METSGECWLLLIWALTFSRDNVKRVRSLTEPGACWFIDWWASNPQMSFCFYLSIKARPLGETFMWTLGPKVQKTLPTESATSVPFRDFTALDFTSAFCKDCNVCLQIHCLFFLMWISVCSKPFLKRLSFCSLYYLWCPSSKEYWPYVRWVYFYSIDLLTSSITNTRMFSILGFCGGFKFE